MQAQSGVDVSVEIFNNGTAKTVSAKANRLSDKRFVIQVMQEDALSDGQYIKTLQRTHGLSRRGTK